MLWVRSHLQKFVLHEVKTTFTFMIQSFISRPRSTENTGTVYTGSPDHTCLRPSENTRTHKAQARSSDGTVLHLLNWLEL